MKELNLDDHTFPEEFTDDDTLPEEFTREELQAMSLEMICKLLVSIPEFSANLPEFSAKYQNFPQNQ